MIPPQNSTPAGGIPANDPSGSEVVPPVRAPLPLATGVQLVGARLEALDGREGLFASGEFVILRVLLFSEIDCAGASVWIGLVDGTGRVVFATSTKSLDLDLRLTARGATEVNFRLPANLGPGRFTINVQCWGGPPDRQTCFFSRDPVCAFDVHNPWLPEFTGIAFLPVQASAAEWRHASNSTWMAPLRPERTGAIIELAGANGEDVALHAKPGVVFAVPVRLTNLSDQWIASKRPYPVLLSYHVHDADDALVVYEGRRTRLECPVPPAGIITQTMLVDAPSVLQRYTLHLTVVQEGRFWFDGFPGNLPRRIALLVSA
jgi:hypothetical protein